MKASMLDLRRRTGEILQALERSEEVEVYHRNRLKGVIRPAGERAKPAPAVRSAPGFGMWRDRADLKDVRAFVAKLRAPRRHAF